MNNMSKETKLENYKILLYQGRKQVYWVELYSYPVDRFTNQIQKGKLMFHNKDNGCIEVINLDRYDRFEIKVL